MKTMDMETIELHTQAIGREIFEKAARDKEALFSGETWTSKLLNWSTRNEEARLQLFRFVDVLPTLTSDADVVRHLDEYFAGRPDPFSGLLKVGLGLGRSGPLGQKAVAATLRRTLGQIARTFIAAESPSELVTRAESLRRAQQTFTVDVLGEATLSYREADEYRDQYLALLGALTEGAEGWSETPLIDRAPYGPIPKVSISVKPTALHPYFDPIDPESSIEHLFERLLPIVRSAKAQGAHLHIDVEEYQLKELTHQAFRDLASREEFSGWRHVGIVLQAYLKDSYADAVKLVEWARSRGTPITVRLVKGAYWDYETVRARLEGWAVPVYTRKDETDANFERITRYLLDHNDVIDLAIASHNVRSIAHALAYSRYIGMPKNAIEFQFLYGMASSLSAALTSMGERVRVYLTYGALIPGMAYLVRRLLENTSNESIVRKGFAEGESIESLLRPPVTATPSEFSDNGRMNGQPPKRQPAPSLGTAAFYNHPHLDFSLESNREEMRRALNHLITNRIGQHVPLLIGDREIETSERYRSIDPANPERLVGTASMGDEQHAALAVAEAAKAFDCWSRTPVSRRSDILLTAAEMMAQRRFELASWMVLEGGKPWREADGDVAEAIDFLRYYALQSAEVMDPRRLTAFQGEVNVYIREPRGVTAVIAPWNFPLAILTGMTAAALATGNTVVVKPAEPTPIIAYHMVRILREAGVPSGALSYLPGSGSRVGNALVEHPDVHLIAFTGSREVGLAILERASRIAPGQRHVKRVIAEMGGKNAIIVDADADLDEAVAGVVTSAFGFAGQKCSACSRVIVLESIYDAFVSRLVEAAKSFPLGRPEDPRTRLGPVITREAMERIHGYIEDGATQGAALYIGRVDDELRSTGGFYVAPAIFGDVPNDAVIACEEIFGPVLACMRVRTFEEGIRLAMDSDFALTGGVYSRSPGHVRLARERFRVGNLYVNRKTTGALVGRQPFGGLRLSGIGFKAGGPDYLLQFTEARTVTEHTLRRGFASEDTGGPVSPPTKA